MRKRLLHWCAKIGRRELSQLHRLILNPRARNPLIFVNGCGAVPLAVELKCRICLLDYCSCHDSRAVGLLELLEAGVGLAR